MMQPRQLIPTRALDVSNTFTLSICTVQVRTGYQNRAISPFLHPPPYKAEEKASAVAKQGLLSYALKRSLQLLIAHFGEPIPPHRRLHVVRRRAECQSVETKQFRNSRYGAYLRLDAVASHAFPRKRNDILTQGSGG